MVDSNVISKIDVDKEYLIKDTYARDSIVNLNQKILIINETVKQLADELSLIPMASESGDLF